MRETIGANTRCQNQPFCFTDKPKTNLATKNFKINLSIHLNKFFQFNFQKNFLIADKSSVRILRVFYLSLIGENTK